MITLERKLWNLNLIAERIHNLSVMTAMEATHLTRGLDAMAIFLDEIKKLSNVMIDVFENFKFNNEEADERDLNEKMTQLSSMMKLLSFNGVIISMNYIKDRFMAICADQLFEYSKMLQRLVDPNYSDAYIDLEVCEIENPNKVSTESVYLLSFTAGGIDFAENIHYIQEILHYPGVIHLVNEGKLNLKGCPVDVFRLSDVLSCKKPEDIQEMKIIILEYSGTTFGVIVDKINIIFKSGLGINSESLITIKNKDIIRECWDTNINRQLNFVDWLKLKA